MEQHVTDSTMMRNGCLTICHFKIPQDVVRAQNILNLLTLIGNK